MFAALLGDVPAGYTVASFWQYRGLPSIRRLFSLTRVRPMPNLHRKFERSHRRLHYDEHFAIGCAGGSISGSSGGAGSGGGESG
jgi:hypothetical protein